MINKLTQFELRKLISERMLILEDINNDVAENKGEYKFDKIITSNEEEVRFRQFVLTLEEDYLKLQNLFRKGIDGIKFRDSKIGPNIPPLQKKDKPGNRLNQTGPRNIYVRTAWVFKTKGGKSLGQLYEESKKVHTGNRDKVEEAAVTGDLTGMKDFDWENIVPIVKGFCSRGDQLGAEVLVLLYAKWHCSTVEGTGDDAVVKTTEKWEPIKKKLGEFLKVGIAAGEKIGKMVSPPDPKDKENLSKGIIDASGSQISKAVDAVIKGEIKKSEQP